MSTRFVFGIICIFLGLIVTEAIDTYYMDTHCGDTRDIFWDDAIRVKLSNGRYRTNMDCTISVTTLSSSRLMLYFRSMDIEFESACNYDWLEIHDGDSRTDKPLTGQSRLCGTNFPSEVFTSTDDTLTMYFNSDDLKAGNGFDVIITSFHTGPCLSYEYLCDNGRCIDEGAKCNDYNPCGDQSDCQFSFAAALGIAIGGITLIVVVAISILIYRRNMRTRSYPVRSLVNPVASIDRNLGGYNQPVATSYQGPPSYDEAVASPPYTRY